MEVLDAEEYGSLQSTCVDSAKNEQRNGYQSVEKRKDERQLAASILQRALAIEAHFFSSKLTYIALDIF